MTAHHGVVIVGGGSASVSAALALVDAGYAGRVQLLVGENALPYERPPLSKAVLARRAGAEDCVLPAVSELTARGVELQLGVAATALDPRSRTVTTQDDSGLRRDVHFDSAVIATGVRSLNPFATLPRGVHTLRTIADALALRDAVLENGSVLIVGGGLIGTEAAASFASLGVDVTLVGSEGGPLAGVNPLIAPAVRELHVRHGVRYVGAGRITGFVADDEQVMAIRTDDGTTLSATCVLLCTGSAPNTEWLEGSGIALRDGAIANQFSQVAPDVYAAGDVARWFHPSLERTVRFENQQNAMEHGLAVGDAINGDIRPYAPLRYAWTYQYETHVQMMGITTGQGRSAVLQDGIGSDQLVVGHEENGRLVGAVGWNAAQVMRRMRRLIAENVRWSDLKVLAAPPTDVQSVLTHQTFIFEKTIHSA